MGADFCFDYVPIKTGQEEKVKEKMLKAVDNFDLPELSNNIKIKLVSQLNKMGKNMEEFTEYWEGIGRDFNENMMPVDEEDEVLTEEKAREDMKEAVNEWFECLNYRDVGQMQHKGDTIYLTGGMSWGDPATDSSSVFHRFTYLPPSIWKAGGIK